MRYITGIHALNLPCSLATCGDWHASALRWKNITFRDSEQSIFGLYGIEYGVKIPEHDKTYAAANHIRALLDLLELGRYASAQGMREDFICNDGYTEEVFKQVALMKSLANWCDIDHFMGREYLLEWLTYREKNGI
jgi:hypothetical protein